MSKLIMVDGAPIKYQIWDTAGQEKYHSLAPMYYRGAAAAIIVYDITRAQSFNTLKNWVRELQQLGPENIVIAVCGNKSDLEEQRVRSRVTRPCGVEVAVGFGGSTPFCSAAHTAMCAPAFSAPCSKSAQLKPRHTLTRLAACSLRRPLS